MRVYCKQAKANQYLKEREEKAKIQRQNKGEEREREPAEKHISLPWREILEAYQFWELPQCFSLVEPMNSLLC